MNGFNCSKCRLDHIPTQSNPGLANFVPLKRQLVFIEISLWKCIIFCIITHVLNKENSVADPVIIETDPDPWIHFVEKRIKNLKPTFFCIFFSSDYPKNNKY